MNERCTHIALTALLVLCARVVSAEVVTWKVDGDPREAIVYVPASPAGGRVPLVFSFHGRGDEAQNFQYTDLHVAWPDAIVVYFQGLETSGGLSGWQVERGQRAAERDARFMDPAHPPRS